MTKKSEAYFLGEITRLKDQVSHLREEQAEFMADYNAIIEMMQKKLHRLENRGCDE